MQFYAINPIYFHIDFEYSNLIRRSIIAPEIHISVKVLHSLKRRMENFKKPLIMLNKVCSLNNAYNFSLRS